jgi:asparagine N-glycosylation enzyme membrane subunit Stt3
MAPQGYWEPLTLHPYVGYFMYVILRIFDPDVNLMYAVSFTPVATALLALACFLFILRIFGCRPSCALVSSLFLMLAPIFLKRSTFGWYDNDPYNTMFPLLIIAVLITGMAKRHDIKKSVLYALACSALINLYALFWQGWVFFLTVIIVSGIATCLYSHFIARVKNETPKIAAYYGTIIVGAFIGVSLSLGMKEFFTLFQEGITALKNFLAPQLTAWPDIYIGVGELKKSSLSFIKDITGGWIFFIVSLCGIILPAVSLLKSNKNNIMFFIIFLSTFLAGSLYITKSGNRFRNPKCSS